MEISMETRRKVPEEKYREKDMVLMMQLNRQWQPRRMVVTKDYICFAFAGEEEQIDFIPLKDVEYVKVWQDLNSTGRRNSFCSVEKSSEETYAFQIATEKSGHNSGRSYYLAPSSKGERESLIHHLSKLSKASRKRAAAKTLFEKYQLKVLKQYEARWFQALMAILIAANFGCTIVESQFMDDLADANGKPSTLGHNLTMLNIFFTTTFTVELAVNAFANWWYPFVRNAWSMLDAFVVAMSLVSVVDNTQPTGIVRILRALRVIRLFGRVKKLRKIIDALSMAILPVLNVFLILFLIMGIFAVVGVSAFGIEAPSHFAVFDKALVTLFRVTSGDPWPEEPPILDEGGAVDYLVFGYQFAYTVIIIWIIVQVSVAVLLDSFIGASVRMEEEEKVAKAEMKLLEQTLRNPMEPLLLRIAKDFSDNQDLSYRLRKLYKELDVDGSGGLDSQEFCVAIKKLDFKPRIHMTDSDFRSMTDDLKLCDAEGQLGAEEFERVMRRQIRHLAQSKLVLNTLDRSADEADFMLHGTLKLIFMEQTNTENRLDAIAHDVRRVARSLQALALGDNSLASLLAAPEQLPRGMGSRGRSINGDSVVAAAGKEFGDSSRHSSTAASTARWPAAPRAPAGGELIGDGEGDEHSDDAGGEDKSAAEPRFGGLVEALADRLAAVLRAELRRFERGGPGRGHSTTSAVIATADRLAPSNRPERGAAVQLPSPSPLLREGALARAGSSRSESASPAGPAVARMPSVDLTFVALDEVGRSRQLWRGPAVSEVEIERAGERNAADPPSPFTAAASRGPLLAAPLRVAHSGRGSETPSDELPTPFAANGWAGKLPIYSGEHGAAAASHQLSSAATTTTAASSAGAASSASDNTSNSAALTCLPPSAAAAAAAAPFFAAAPPPRREAEAALPLTTSTDPSLRQGAGSAACPAPSSPPSA